MLLTARRDCRRGGVMFGDHSPSKRWGGAQQGTCPVLKTPLQFQHFFYYTRIIYVYIWKVECSEVVHSGDRAVQIPLLVVALGLHNLFAPLAHPATPPNIKYQLPFTFNRNNNELNIKIADSSQIITYFEQKVLNFVYFYVILLCFLVIIALY